MSRFRNRERSTWRFILPFGRHWILIERGCPKVLVKHFSYVYLSNKKRYIGPSDAASREYKGLYTWTPDLDKVREPGSLGTAKSARRIIHGRFGMSSANERDEMKAFFCRGEQVWYQEISMNYRSSESGGTSTLTLNVIAQGIFDARAFPTGHVLHSIQHGTHYLFPLLHH